MTDKKHSQQGFALLMALIVVGSVLSIGVVILDLSVKQVRLATTTKDSEIAFHAANAGMECARFWRRDQNEQMTTGAITDPIECFGTSYGPVTAAVADVDDVDDGAGYVYEYDITWASGERCTSITTVVAVGEPGGDGVVVIDMETFIPGYPGGDQLTCDEFSQCTVVAVQGYNQPCSRKASFGTIEREVLLEF